MSALNWQRRTPLKTRDQIYNTAIHKLIMIKRRRTEDGASQKSILRVQKEIDKLMKLRDDHRKAQKFVEWRIKIAK